MHDCPWRPYDFSSKGALVRLSPRPDNLGGLQQKFLAAPTWGQAGLQGGGNVTHRHPHRRSTPNPASAKGDGGKEPRPTRTMRANAKVIGPGHVKSGC